MIYVVFGCLIFGAIIELILRRFRKLKSLEDKHVVVVGGSSGIGKAIAAQMGVSARAVTLISRSAYKLQRAYTDISSQIPPHCSVHTEVADTTDLEKMKYAISNAVRIHGTPDYLIVAAGSSSPGYFLEQSIDVFRNTMELNYMGTVVSVKCVLPYMMARNSGHIVLISSAAGVSGWLGYTSYCPSKFAVRGLAESLRSELAGCAVNVSIAYPPDTMTPGFTIENRLKPRETLQLFPSSGAYTAESVACNIVHSLRCNDFHCMSPDFLGDQLVSLMSGVTPIRFYTLDVLLHPLRVVAAFAFRFYADHITGQYARTNVQLLARNKDLLLSKNN